MWTDPADSPRRASRSHGRGALILLLLTLLGFALRLPLLDRFPLREDEAIYGYWALHGLFVDPLYLHVWPDKPPLFLWLQAAAFTLWGHSPLTAEAAARLPSIFASTLTIPVLAVTARRWWGETAAVVTALLAALSPFAVSFAPTAFTDSVLVLAGSLALALAVRRRWLWSGVWLGAAIMTKQQGVLFLPLLAAALPSPPPIEIGGYVDAKPVETGWGVPAPPSNRPWPVSHGVAGGFNPRRLARRTTPPLPHHSVDLHQSGGGPPVERRRTQKHFPALFHLAAFLTGLALVVLPILCWDSLRWTVAPSPWDLGATNVGGVGWADMADWPARAAEWGQLVWYLLASPWAWAVYGLALLGATGLVVHRRAAAHNWLPALLLAAWAAGFLLLHIATNVQVWDRYLLPLTIPLSLLGGWAATVLAALPVGHACSVTPPPVGHACSVTAATIGRATGRHAASATYALLLALTLLPAWQAAQGELPIGGDHGAYAGLNEALAAVDGPHTLLFHRELGWHARFALFDSVRSGALELRYYPSSVYLADSATKSPHKERYVVVPDWSPLPDLPMQLAMRGLQAHEELRTGHFTVYRIDERPTGDRSWRLCALP